MKEGRLTDEQLAGVFRYFQSEVEPSIGQEVGMTAQLFNQLLVLDIIRELKAARGKIAELAAELEAERGEVARLNQMIDAGRGVNARLREELETAREEIVGKGAVINALLVRLQDGGHGPIVVRLPAKMTYNPDGVEVTVVSTRVKVNAETTD